MKRSGKRRLRLFLLHLPLFGLLGLLVESPETAQAGETEKEIGQLIKKLEQDVKLVEQQRSKDKLERKRAELGKRRSTNKTKLEGFFTIGAATVYHNPGLILTEEDVVVDEGINFRLDTVAALQIRHRFDERGSYTQQMIYRAADIERKLSTEWAYYSYKIKPDFMIRAGRLRGPLYMFSESLEVGFSYPWTRPPLAIYQVPLTGLEGMDLLYDFSIGNWYAQLQLGYGDGIDRVGGQYNALFETSETVSTVLTLNRYPFSARIGYIHGLASVVPDSNSTDTDTSFQLFLDFIKGEGSEDYLGAPFNAEDLVNTKDAVNDYFNIGLRFDDGRHLALFEFSYFQQDNFPSVIGPGGYILYGYRFGKWFPYFTLGAMLKNKDTEDIIEKIALRVRDVLVEAGQPIQAAVVSESTRSLLTERLINPFRSIALGVNYYLHSNVRLKADVIHYDHFEGGSAVFVEPPEGSNAIYSVAVDMVF